MASMENLDNEISAIRAQISSLRARRANLSAVLLSTPRLSTRLSTRLQQRPAANNSLTDNAMRIIKRQSERNLENVYRACAGVTAYKIKDPDPNAVDDGNVLGVRIEVFVEGKFIETYHVLFNRPSTRHKSMLKIHRHTIPACIPLKQLANKFLPQSQRDASTTTEQNLVKLGRVLRKELVAWHLRNVTLERLRAEAGLSDKAAQERIEKHEPAYGKILNAHVSNAFVSDDEDDFVEVQQRKRLRKSPATMADIEADLAVRQISIAWSNGQTAVMEITKDGEIVKAVVKKEDGSPMSSLSRKALGRIEGLITRLSS